MLHPVYERAGGHAYGSVYPGPIGAILNPLLKGVGNPGPEGEQVDSLPYASSLCGACFEACPVRIDIPSVLVDQRAQVVDARRGHGLRGLGSGHAAEAIAFKGAAVALADARKLGFGERFTGIGLRMAKRLGSLPGLSKWAAARDLPPAPPESFRAWWERTDGGRSESRSESRSEGGQQ